jgi:hypothetical protein
MISIQVASHPRHKKSGIQTAVLTIADLRKCLSIKTGLTRGQTVTILIVDTKGGEYPLINNDNKRKNISSDLLGFVGYVINYHLYCLIVGGIGVLELNLNSNCIFGGRESINEL